MVNKSNRLVRNSGMLMIGLLMLGLAGCFGKSSQQLMASSIKSYMKSNPVTEQLNYMLPGAIIFPRGDVYAASGQELENNEVAVLRKTASVIDKEKLAELVEIGWLHKKEVTAWPEEHNYTKAWLMTIGSDPKLLSVAESFIRVIKNKLQPLDAALEPYPLKFFWHMKITKQHTLEFPTKLAAKFFVLPSSSDSEEVINVFHALAFHGYLAQQKIKVWTGWIAGGYVKTIPSGFGRYLLRTTGNFYFITSKGKPWLKRNPDYSSNNSDPTVTLATADIYKPLAIKKNGSDITLYVTGKMVPSPLWNLGEVRDWVKSSSVLSPIAVKNIGKSVVLKINVEKFTGDYQFSSFLSGKPQALLVYQLTKIGKTFLGGGSGGTITYGKWKFLKITNYTKSKHNTFGGRMVNVLFKFESTLPVRTMKAVAAVADSAKKIIRPSTTKAGQCLLVKMHQGWKVEGCQLGS